MSAPATQPANTSPDVERPARPTKSSSSKPLSKKRKKNNLEEAMVKMCQRLSGTTPATQTSAEKRRISYCNYMASEVILMCDAQFLRFVNSTNILVHNMAQERLSRAPQVAAPITSSSFQPDTFAQSTFPTPATYSQPHVGGLSRLLCRTRPGHSNSHSNRHSSINMYSQIILDTLFNV